MCLIYVRLLGYSTVPSRCSSNIILTNRLTEPQWHVAKVSDWYSLGPRFDSWLGDFFQKKIGNIAEALA